MWVLLLLVAILWVFSFFLTQFPGFVIYYSDHIYPSIQSGRHTVFGAVPFSIGDVLYIIGGIWLLVTLTRWVYFVRKFGAYKDRLAGSVLNVANTGLMVYLVFLLGWGANYSKEPLARSWGLKVEKSGGRKALKAREIAALGSFNKFLVDRLNQYAPQYSSLPYSHINDRALVYYREFTTSKVKDRGLGIKGSLFGYFLQRMGIDGYYNPFTSEGQITKRIPVFMMPFTVCHEMAHQAGIAAEGDANLLAYAVATAADDPVFRYSAYLNIWLYTNNRLFRYDSAQAKHFSGQLNMLTIAHLDTLDQISQKYHGLFSSYTSDIFDSYLRLQQQADGILTYGNVSREAWLWEQKRIRSRNTPIQVP